MFIDSMTIPDDFYERMKQSMPPEEFKAFLASYKNEPVKSLRINRLKKYSGVNAPDLFQMFSLSPVEWCGNGYYYKSDTLPGKHPLHEAGAYYIQEASAMAPVQWLDVKKGMKVLDLCASPGGKSTEIAEIMDNTGLMIANEPDRSRAKILSLNIERLGIKNTLVTNESPERLAGVFEGYFDRILVDAPCSGEGMFRKNPEAVSNWSTENVSMCAARQDMILENAAKMLSPGGLMVYSTCTFSREEDEGSVERFLEREKDFCLVSPDSIRSLPKAFLTSPISPGGEKAGEAVRLMSHRLRGEGHFFAILKRKGQTPAGSITVSGSGKLKEAPDASKKLFLEFLKESIAADFTLPKGILHEFGDQLYLSDTLMPGITGLKVLRPGLHLGTLKNKRFEPAHALALFLSPKDAEMNAALPDQDSAYGYLKGGSLPSEFLNIPEKKGWCLVSFMGMSLGWGKNDGRIIKNHYPKGLRIN